MIRIGNADLLQDKIKLIYNPLSDLTLALDALCRPGQKKLHLSWIEEILSRLSQKEIRQLHYFDSLIDGYLNTDLHIDFLAFDYAAEDSCLECSRHLKNKENRISPLQSSEVEPLFSFLSFMWDNYITPVVKEHFSIIREQLDRGIEILEQSGYRKLFAAITERISVRSDGLLKIEKWVDSDFDAEVLDAFYVELSLFAFPYLVISDRHDSGSFYLSWDVPFRNDCSVIPAIERISTVAFALSDKSRLRILLLLSEGPMTQKELTRVMGFAKSTISRHIGILLSAGLIKQENPGRNVLLRLDRNSYRELSTKIKRLLE